VDEVEVTLRLIVYSATHRRTVMDDRAPGCLKRSQVHVDSSATLRSYIRHNNDVRHFDVAFDLAELEENPATVLGAAMRDRHACQSHRCLRQGEDRPLKVAIDRRLIGRSTGQSQVFSVDDDVLEVRAGADVDDVAGSGLVHCLLDAVELASVRAYRKSSAVVVAPVDALAGVGRAA